MKLDCPKCGSPMSLRTTQKYRYGNGQPRKFWGCSRWPDCDCVHGAHADGKPLGIPADDATKQARIKAHAAFDRLWKPELGGPINRRQAYRVMQELMGMDGKEAHIGRFDAADCERLCAAIEEHLQKFRGHPFPQGHPVANQGPLTVG